MTFYDYWVKSIAEYWQWKLGLLQKLKTNIQANRVRDLLHSDATLLFVSWDKYDTSVINQKVRLSCNVPQSHLEITLISVENHRLLSVEFSLHFQRQSTNGWLEVRLFGVHHQPHPMLHGILWHRAFNWILNRKSIFDFYIYIFLFLQFFEQNQIRHLNLDCNEQGFCVSSNKYV